MFYSPSLSLFLFWTRLFVNYFYSFEKSFFFVFAFMLYLFSSFLVRCFIFSFSQLFFKVKLLFIFNYFFILLHFRSVLQRKKEEKKTTNFSSLEKKMWFVESRLERNINKWRQKKKKPEKCWGEVQSLAWKLRIH